MEAIENKDDVSDELDLLASLLNEVGVCDDTAALVRGAGFCRSNSTAELYTYQINRLVFNLMDPPGGTIPLDKLGNLKDLKAILTIDLKGRYISNFNDICNPFFNLKFDVELQCNDSDENPYLAAWHLDKHISQPGDGKPKYHHPEYHMAFGGDLMTGRNDYGGLFLLPSPRFCYPPMEAILGVDFIMRNFYETTISEDLLTNTKYIELVKNAQYRFWRPFSISFASKWETFPGVTIQEDFSHPRTFPELF
jgi:hypothetical protein